MVRPQALHLALTRPAPLSPALGAVPGAHVVKLSFDACCQAELVALAVAAAAVAPRRLSFPFDGLNGVRSPRHDHGALLQATR